MLRRRHQEEEENSGNGGYSENFRSWDLDAENDCGEEFEIGCRYVVSVFLRFGNNF
jgi:hypothetical protein